jgi:cytochrome P450
VSEASVNVAANGVVALLSSPREHDRLRRDPALSRTAVEELIRHDTPLSVFDRTVFAPVEVAGRVLAPGERVGLLLGAANRDERAFDDADTLDVGRDPTRTSGSARGSTSGLGRAARPLGAAHRPGAAAREVPAAGAGRGPDPAARPTFQCRGHTTAPVRLG